VARRAAFSVKPEIVYCPRQIVHQGFESRPRYAKVEPNRMSKTLTWFLICAAVVCRMSLSSGSELTEVPNFGDREKWLFVEEHPLIYSGLGQEIGTVKKYRHNMNQSLVGFEEFITGHEKAFWKRWGFESTLQMYHALRKKDSEGWIIGPPGSHWHSVGVLEGIALKGVWFFLFIPSQEEAFGRYFALPSSRYKSTDPKKDTGI
jgi:hypothetical protein